MYSLFSLSSAVVGYQKNLPGNETLLKLMNTGKVWWIQSFGSAEKLWESYKNVSFVQLIRTHHRNHNKNLERFTFSGQHPIYEDCTKQVRNEGNEWANPTVSQLPVCCQPKAQRSYNGYIIFINSHVQCYTKPDSTILFSEWSHTVSLWLIDCRDQLQRSFI